MSIKFFTNKFFVWPFFIGIAFFSAYLILNKENYFEENHYKNASQISKQIASAQDQFNQLIANGSLNSIEGFDKKGIQQLDKLNVLPFVVQVYIDGQARFWNKNSVEISKQIIENHLDDKQYLQELSNGSYIIFNKRISSSKNIVGILPIVSHYSIENKYLKKVFNRYLSEESGYNINTVRSGYDVVLDGKYLFSVSPQDSCKSCNHKFIYFFLFIVGIFLILYSIHIFCVSLSSFYPMISFLVLIVLTYSLRHYLLKTQTPSFLYMKTMLFDSNLYAASKLNPSLGDFLFFVFWCNWMILYFSRYVSFDFAIIKNAYGRFIVHTLILIFLLGETVSISKIFENMVLNSSISFDFNFFPKISRFSILGISSLLLCFANYYVLIRKFVRINSKNKLSIPLFILSVAITLGLYYYLLHNKLHAPIQLYLIVIIVMSVILLLYYYYKVRKIKSFFIPLLFLLFSATSSTILLDFYNSKKQERYLYKLAEKLVSERDTITELSFKETKERIKRDAVFQIYFEDSLMHLDELKDYLIVNYLGQYTSKYSIQLTTFDVNRHLNKTNEIDSFSSAYELLDDSFKVLTSCPELFFSKLNNRYKYYSILPIKSKEIFFGNILIEFKPRQIVNNNLYPELLLQDAELNSESYDNINFALYSSNELIIQKGSYPHHYKLDKYKSGTRDNYSFIDNAKFKHQVYKFDQDKIVIISTETSDFLSPLSLLSYVFCFYLVLYTIGIVIYNLVSIVRRFRVKVDRFKGISLRTKINLFIILLVLFFFTIIGFISYNYFSEKYENYHKEYLINKQKTVMSSLQLFVKDFNKENQADLLKMHTKDLVFFISRLAETNNIDINLFDSDGKLILSSQRSIFDNGLMSNLINPESFKEELITESNQKLIEEQIGKLKYVSISSSLFNESNQLLGYVNIPYFSKSKNLQSDFYSFIVALLNVYIILLIVTILLAFFVSNSITRPLKVIGEKMINIDLKGSNKPINYSARDELGDLVRKYNQMVEELQKSAVVLAQSERESAWREMAKQVAHEIKNPLTPMKLSIQYLQKAIKEDPDRSVFLAERVSKTLIEQIDHLVDIANAFSSFAKMSKTENEVVNLNSVLNNICDLFKQEPDTNILFISFDNKPIVFLDRNQLVSAFNNIIKNAIQSRKQDEIVDVNVELTRLGSMFKIKISDNGIGINEANRLKIFEPNFTTKNSGTGLGMAITKKIIDTAGGIIYFDSQVGLGTNFYIELPIYNEE